MTSAAETQRCYDSLRYPRERLYHDLDAAEVKQRSTSCRMCRTLWQCLTVANNGPPRTHADGGTLRVRTLSTRFACFVLANTDLRIELKRLSVGLVPAKPGHGAEDTNDFKDALVVLYHAFQTCDSYPESVEALCEWEGRQLSSDSTMYGGRYRPLDADFRLVRWWMDYCNQSPHLRCNPQTRTWNTHRDDPIRKVDVLEQCIVELPFTQALRASSRQHGKAETTTNVDNE